MFGEFAEIIGLILFGTVKFLFTPSAIMALGYTFWETIAISLTGGWLGVLVFYYAGSAIFGWIAEFKKSNEPKKKFSKRNRWVIWLKNSFGIGGVVAIIGVASIPIICLLAAKYFRHDKRTVYYLLFSILVWAFGLTGLSFLFKPYLLELL
jgi:hypothetical protein